VDSGIARWMEVVTVNFTWKLLHSRCSVILQDERSVLQRTIRERYCTASGQCYWRFTLVCYSEHYVKCTAQHVDSGISGYVECVILNFKWKLIHSRWTVVLQLGECYSEYYAQGTAQRVDSVISGWMEWVTVNNTWKLLHSMWTVVLQVKWCVLYWTLSGS